jgi:hypothetical protein
MYSDYHDRHHRDEVHPMYQVNGPFPFFMSLLLMVWKTFQLIVTVCLRDMGVFDNGEREFLEYRKRKS